MDFTIYTFGDVEIFRAALMGLAMIYNPANGFFVSNTGVGLGALAGLGLLIGLTVLLLQGVTKQKLDIGEFLMLIIVFVVLFVPKFSVNIEDYNGSAIAKVDDVPLGVALPAGLVSGLAHELNNKLGTAYSTINGYPTGLMTPQALTSPLKLLHSLRDAAPQARFYEPRLYSNLRNLIAYCAAGREGVQQEWERLRVGDDPVLKLVTFAGTQHGLTMFIPAGGTEAYLDTCGKAANDIASGIAAFSSNGSPASTISNVLTAAAARSNAATIIFDGTRPRVEPVTVDKQEEALAMLALSEAGDAANFLRSAIFNPDINATLHCAGKSANPADWKNCMPFQEGVLRYAEDSAAAGSFFQRLMYHGMNLVFFLWICLAPVVSVVMLMMGVRGLRLAGSYLLFGAWAVSWYVGASIINFYVLKQVQYEVAMLGGIKNLTPESINSFIGYGGVLGTKIAMAGDMLASVPLLMMAVMSGSVYGLTQLASRMGGRDYYDEARNVPAARGSAAVYGTESMADANYRPGFNMGPAKQMMDAPVLSDGAALRAASIAQQQTVVEASRGQSYALSNALSSSIESGRIGEIGHNVATGFKSVGAEGLSAVTSLATSLEKAKQASQGEDRRFLEQASGSLSLGLKGLGTGAGVGFKTDLQRLKHLGISENDIETAKKLSTGDTSFSAQLSREASAQSTTKFAETATAKDAASRSEAWSSTIQKMEKHSEAFSTQQSIENAMAIERRVDTGRLVQMMDTPAGQAVKASINRAASQFEGDDAYDMTVKNLMSSYKRTGLADYKEEHVKAVAQLEAMGRLSSNNPAAGIAFSNTLGEVNGTQGMRGFEGDVQGHKSINTGEAEKTLNKPNQNPIPVASTILATSRSGATNTATVTTHYELEKNTAEAHKPDVKLDPENRIRVEDKIRNNEKPQNAAMDWVKGVAPRDAYVQPPSSSKAEKEAMDRKPSNVNRISKP